MCKCTLVRSRLLVKPRRTFRNKDDLRVHTRVLTDEKPFACPTCGRMFEHRNAMQTHMRVHSDKKLFFTCLFCNRGFRHKNVTQRRTQVRILRRRGNSLLANICTNPFRTFPFLFFFFKRSFYSKCRFHRTFVRVTFATFLSYSQIQKILEVMMAIVSLCILVALVRDLRTAER